MTRLKSVANIILGICYEIFFALVLIGGAFFIGALISAIYLKP